MTIHGLGMMAIFTFHTVGVADTENGESEAIVGLSIYDLVVPNTSHDVLYHFSFFHKGERKKEQGEQRKGG